MIAAGMFEKQILVSAGQQCTMVSLVLATCVFLHMLTHIFLFTGEPSLDFWAECIVGNPGKTRSLWVAWDSYGHDCKEPSCVEDYQKHSLLIAFLRVLLQVLLPRVIAQLQKTHRRWHKVIQCAIIRIAWHLSCGWKTAGSLSLCNTQQWGKKNQHMELL